MTVYIFPVVFIGILSYAFLKKVPIFDTFLKGAKRGADSCFAILPALVGLVVAVSMLKASGVLLFLANILAPLLNFISMPGDVLPLALLKSVSGSGAVAMLKSIFETSGVDSPSGRLASVMLGSSETTFYVLAVYFGITKVKNTRYTVLATVLADIMGIVAAVAVTNLFWT
jgi:spore maturation protein B